MISFPGKNNIHFTFKNGWTMSILIPRTDAIESPFIEISSWYGSNVSPLILCAANDIAFHMQRIQTREPL